MRFSDVQTWATAWFTSLAYNPMPVINPGPATDQLVQKAGPGRLIFLTVGGGPGLNTEAEFDQTFITARVIGRQMSYADAENMAVDLDRGLLQLCTNGVMGTARYTHVTRTGGKPILLQLDVANRYHFQCSYIIDAQTEG